MTQRGIMDSIIKTSRDGFNNQPDRITLEKLMNDKISDYKIVDIEDQYWQNEEDTLVILIPKGDQPIQLNMKMCEFIMEIHADEFMTVEVDEGIVIRFWWD